MDNDDRDQHEYFCRAPSCGESFYKAPPSWFESRGMSEPRFCDSCRAWFRLQESVGSQTVSCTACGHAWDMSPEYRISYRKKIGDWDVDREALLCVRCENNPLWRFKQRERLATARLKKMAERIDVELVENEFGDDVGGAMEIIATKRASSRTSFDVPVEAEFYERTKNYGRRAQHGENQLKHILKPEHQWKQKLGTDDPRMIVKQAAEIASQTGEYIAEMKQANGSIIKCDVRTGLVVIIKPDAASVSGHSIETAFMAGRGAEAYLRGKLKV